MKISPSPDHTNWFAYMSAFLPGLSTQSVITVEEHSPGTFCLPAPPISPPWILIPNLAFLKPERVLGDVIELEAACKAPDEGRPQRPSPEAKEALIIEETKSIGLKTKGLGGDK